MSTAPLVRVEGITRIFGTGDAALRALDGVDLDVAAGEVVGLRGPSGSGKSTLLNIIACILEPSAGRLILDGQVPGDKDMIDSIIDSTRFWGNIAAE